MLDDAAVLLHGARQEARHVLERHQRDVERVAEADEPRPLDRRVDVEGAGEVRRLVRDDSRRLPSEAREADHEVRREVPVDLQELAVVADRPDQVQHVVRLVRRLRHEGVEGRVLPAGGVGRLDARRVVQVVARQVAEQQPQQRQAVLVGRDREVGGAALHVVRHRPAELVLRHLLVGDGADHVRPGDEHAARPLDHHREVGDGRGIDRAPGARSHDGRDLRDDAGSERVAQEDVRVAGQRGDPLLDPGPARVVETDHRRAVLHRQIHDLDDLRGVGFRQRPAEHREVLREGVDEAAFDLAVAGHDAVARHELRLHPEVAAAVRDQLVGLAERAGIEEEVDPFARGQLAGVVLPPAARLAAARLRAALVVRQRFQFVHAVRSVGSRKRRVTSCWPAPVPSRPGTSPGRRR